MKSRVRIPIKAIIALLSELPETISIFKQELAEGDDNNDGKLSLPEVIAAVKDALNRDDLIEKVALAIHEGL
tara:strand:+ start:342 stop:557 length:216 start_codon:yes stop_codon:yes gene_type:complete